MSKKDLKPRQIRQIAVDHYMKYIDFEWNSRMAIGKAWKNLSPDEQKEYIKEYTLFLAYTWLPKLNYNTNDGVRIKVKPDVIPINKKDDNVVVHIITPDSKVYEVFIRVREYEENMFKITNVTVEGIDLAMSYRVQFEQYIEQNGGSSQKLLQYIKDKNEENKKNVDFTVNLK
jgi:phospholipid transport system substrate-binding protein